MTPADSIDFARQAIWVLLEISAPAMIAALVIGLVIGLLQALTQIQEMTLSFIPKIVVMGVVLIVAGPWMLDQLVAYSHDLYGSIPSLVGP